MKDDRKEEMDFRMVQKKLSENERNNTRRQYELSDERKYKNMHARGIKATRAALNILRGSSCVLMVASLGYASFSFANTLKEKLAEKYSSDDTPEKVVDYIYDSEDGKSVGEYDEESGIISADEVSFDGVTFVLRAGTSNVGDIVDVTERELTGLGVDVVSIDDSDDLVKKAGTVMEANKNVIVVNVDGVSNKTDKDIVFMTTFNNDYTNQSGDGLALAIQCECEDTFGMPCEIKSGKNDLASGVRVKTSVEDGLTVANLMDVACLTVAVSSTAMDTEIEVNNIATAITNGIVRYASLTKGEQEDDYIYRVEFADTVSEIAEENGVTSSYIISANQGLTSGYGSGITSNTALIVKEIPTNLTSEVKVDNPLVTTNVSETNSVVQYYTVEPGDTLSEIAKKLNVNQSDLIVDTDNPDKIIAGQEISYSVEGKILISPQTKGKSK